MPVNEVQQVIASVLTSLDGRLATVIWIGFAAIGITFLLVLALAPLLPEEIQNRLERRPILRASLSDKAFLMTVVVALVVTRLPVLSQLQLNPDESNLILAARTLLQDPRYWISIEGQSLGPIATLPAMLPSIFGQPIDFTTIRAVGILIWAVALGAMFLGFRRLYSARMARVLLLPVALTVISFNYWDYVAFNGEHMPVLLLAIAFALHAGLRAETATVQPVRSFSLGFVLALVPFAKIQAGPIALVWGLLAIVLSWRVDPKRAMYHAGGAVFVVASIAFYLVASGALYDFWQSYVLNNLLYAKVGWNAIHQDTTFIDNLKLAPAYFMKVPDSRGLFLLTAAVASIGFAWALVDSRFRSALRGSGAYFAFVIVAVAFVSIIIPKTNWTHYLLLMIIPTGMFIAAVAAAAAETIEGRLGVLRGASRGPRRLSLVSGPVLVGLFIGIAAFTSAGYSLFEGRKNPATWRAAGNLQRGQEPNLVTAAILRHTSPGEPVGHWGVVFVHLAQAGVSLANREAHNERALFPSYQQQYYINRWTQDVMKRRPRIVLDSGAGKFEAFRLEGYPQAYSSVVANYELVDEVAGFRIFRLRVDSAEP